MISVIVPVYRTEKYLKRCVDSILGQSYSALEVILVDDGSPDGCPAICDAYARQDRRVKVIHKENRGVAAARNTGLDAAAGDYITFVDSDDYIEPQMYQAMMDVAVQYDCDVVMCDCVKDFPDHSEIYTHDIRPGYYNREQLEREYFPHLLMMENVEYPATISNWLCLFRQRQSQCQSATQVTTLNKLLNKPSLRYLEGVRYSEDLLFGAQLMYQAASFYYMKGETYYHYFMNPQSATHTFAPDKWRDYLRLYHEAEACFLNRPECDFRRQIDLMLLFFIYDVVGGISGAAQGTDNKKIARMLAILKEPVVTEMFSRLPVVRLPIPIKLKILTLCYKYRIGLRLPIKRAQQKKRKASNPA